MGTYVIYRDGEEVEVGWFSEMLDRLRRFWKTAKQTDWWHYFQGNGPGEVLWKHFTGFRELQNQLDCVAQWCLMVKGGIRNSSGNYYYRNMVAHGILNASEAYKSGIVASQVAHEERILDLYANPECSCRIGYHHKCPHHHTTEN
jgi:hypothetical protein